MHKYAEIVDRGECYSTSKLMVDGIPANRDEWHSGKGNQVTPPVIVHITDAEKLGMHSRGTIRIAKDLMSIETKLGVAEVWNMQYTPFDSHRMVLPTEEDTAGLVFGFYKYTRFCQTIQGILSTRIFNSYRECSFADRK